jgi:hypothetical protein
MQVTNKALRINCYVRIKASGFVGRLGGIYHNDDRDTGTWRTTYGVDWASEYPSCELERISPGEYHASPESLKLSKTNPEPYKGRVIA